MISVKGIGATVMAFVMGSILIGIGVGAFLLVNFSRSVTGAEFADVGSFTWGMVVGGAVLFVIGIYLLITGGGE